MFKAQPRMPAPAFSLPAIFPDLSQSAINLKQFNGRYLVLIFYPNDFSYVCPTELTAFSERIDEFRGTLRENVELDCEVIGVSSDSEHTHYAWMKTPRKQGGVEGIKFPLITDYAREMARDYGVLIENKEDAMYGCTLRGLFIIDRKGMNLDISKES